MEIMDEPCVVETGGSSITHRKHLFSHDAKYLLCPCGNIIKVFSMTTGECFQRLVGHTKLVTGIAHHPKIKLQILSCSLDKTVRLWDYEDGPLLATFTFDRPLIALFSHMKYSNTLLVVKKQDHSKELHKFTLPPLGTPKDFVSTNHVCKVLVDSCEKYIALSERYVVVACSQSFTVFPNPSQMRSKSLIKHEPLLEHREKPITCIACHPSEEILATGHQAGKIRVWFNITSEKKLTCKLQHWHSLDVSSISYSPSGSMLLSGGQEEVLVQWRGMTPDFLPRLGSELTEISTSEDGLLYAVSLRDNSILVISNTFKIKQCIEGFAASTSAILVISNTFKIKQSIEGFAASTSDYPCGFEYDPATKACVTNGKPGHLLFYLCPTDNQLYNLDVICQNFISSEDLSKPLSRTAITNVAFVKTSNSDHHMATLEFNKLDLRDQKLKFWVYDKTQQNWLIETVVTSPHNRKEVTSIIFHPKEKFLVTTSLDGSAKIWHKPEKSWLCDCAVSYRGFQCHQAAFSQDGSVVAFVFDQTVLLANFDELDQMNFFTSLATPIKSLHFGRDSCRHLLVIVASDQIQCWDLTSSSILWYSEVDNIKFVVQDQFSENLALFTNEKEVFIFRPSESTPLFTCEVDDVIMTACFVPEPEEGISWLKKSSLYMITKHAVVKKFTLRSKAEESRSQSLMAEGNANLNTPMSSLLALKIGTPETESETATLRHSTIENAMKYFNDTPVHMLPRMSSLCEQFISSLLFDGAEKENERFSMEIAASEPEEMELSVEKDEKPTSNHAERMTRVEDFDFLAPVFDKLLKMK